MSAAAVEPRFRRVALIGKLHSPEVEASMHEMRGFLASRGCEIVSGSAKAADLAIVIGGDGTMLVAARELVRQSGALIGVNLGRVGFMTDIGRE